MYRGKAEVVCELVLFEVRENDGCEGGEQRRAFVYRAVVYRFPYRLGASFEYSGTIKILVVFYGVAVLDDAFGAAEGRRGARGTVRLLACIVTSRRTRPM